MNRTPSIERAERFITLLVEAREASGLTQVQVAAKLKRPQSYVSKIERGERRLDVIEFLELAETLTIDPLKFLRAFVKAK